MNEFVVPWSRRGTISSSVMETREASIGNSSSCWPPPLSSSRGSISVWYTFWASILGLVALDGEGMPLSAVNGGWAKVSRPSTLLALLGFSPNLKSSCPLLLLALKKYVKRLRQKEINPKKMAKMSLMGCVMKILSQSRVRATPAVKVQRREWAHAWRAMTSEPSAWLVCWESMVYIICKSVGGEGFTSKGKGSFLSGAKGWQACLKGILHF